MVNTTGKGDATGKGGGTTWKSARYHREEQEIPWGNVGYHSQGRVRDTTGKGGKCHRGHTRGKGKIPQGRAGYHKEGQDTTGKGGRCHRKVRDTRRKGRRYNREGWDKPQGRVGDTTGLPARGFAWHYFKLHRVGTALQLLLEDHLLMASVI